MSQPVSKNTIFVLMTNRLIILASIILLFSCKQNNIEPIITNYDTGYFPLEPGFYKVFKGKTIVIDDPSKIFDTTEYYIKELYSGLVTDALGDSVMRIERMVRKNKTDKWQMQSVWTALVSENIAFQTEDNVKYVKIRFPVQQGKIWDGNIYNRIDTSNVVIDESNYKQYRYEIISFDMPNVIGDLAFERTLKIQNSYYLTLIDKIDNYELYAYGIGLVYRQKVDLYSGDIDPGTPIEQRLKTGVSLFEELVEYGYEN